MTRHIVTILLLLLLMAACQAPMARAERNRFEVLVLGVAQDGGLPHVGCNKECCERARREGWVLMPACIAIHDRHDDRLLLVEATAGVGSQLTFLHRLTASHIAKRGNSLMVRSWHVLSRQSQPTSGLAVGRSLD